jgi:nuclear cap-binding protein subunit 2
MGLDRIKKTPCGFAFVIYKRRKDALNAMLLSGSRLDGRVIRVELDAGFQPGRQYGRGKKGGQVRDDVTNKRRKSDASEGGGGGGASGNDEDYEPSAKRQRM